jgi:hypothetical protein
MYIQAKLELQSYMPKQLEPGMLFLRTTKEAIELWELEKVPLEPIEQFLQENGAPYELSLVDEDGDVIAIHEEIGWWDEGPDSDEYRDITLKDINYILNVYDGEVETTAEYYNNKVVICAIGAYDDDEEEQEPEMCSSCNGIGEEIDESPCTSCKGTGVDNQSEWFKNRFGRQIED